MHIDDLLNSAPDPPERPARAKRIDRVAMGLMGAILKERDRRAPRSGKGAVPEPSFAEPVSDESVVEAQLCALRAQAEDRSRLERFHERNVESARSGPWRTLPIAARRALLIDYVHNSRLQSYDKARAVKELTGRKELLSHSSIRYSAQKGRVLSFDLESLIRA